MPKIHLDLTLVNGEELEPVASSPDLIRLETRYNLSWQSLMATPLINPLTGEFVLDAKGELVLDESTMSVRHEHMAFLAWSALRRRRDDRIDQKFETFLDEQLDEVGFHQDDEPAEDGAAVDVDEAVTPAPEAMAGSAG